MSEHKLKTLPKFWDAILRGEKTFELRYNDRDFKKGDTLLLKRWNREQCCYTKPYTPIKVTVTYIMHGGLLGLMNDWVCMGIRIISMPNPGW